MNNDKVPQEASTSNCLAETSDYHLTVGQCWNSTIGKSERGYIVTNKVTGVVEMEHCQLGAAMEIQAMLQAKLDEVRPSSQTDPLMH